MKKIGYYSEGKFRVGGRGIVYSSDIFLVFIQKLLNSSVIKTIGRVSKIDFNPKYPLNEKNSIIKLTHYKSIKSLILIFPFYIIRNRRKINHFIEDIDHLLISASGLISIVLIRKMIKQNKQLYIFIRSDTRRLISTKHNGNVISKVFANIIAYRIEKYIQNYPRLVVFTFGKELFDRYIKLSKNVYSIADSRFCKRDILKENSLVEKNYKKIEIIYVGRLVTGKGLEFLLNTLSTLESSKYSLNIVGDGPIKSKLMKLVEKLDLNQTVKFKGFIPFGEDLLNEYRESHVLILPSFSEGLPQVVIEAMACGTIVIATKVGGLPDLIRTNHNGFLFDAGNSSQLLGILESINSHSIPLLNIRKNALKTAMQFSFENQSKIILNQIK
jgi:glycosyltransferase involved in cell wall biosynthesis